jgi:hypothetical protein
MAAFAVITEAIGGASNQLVLVGVRADSKVFIVSSFVPRWRAAPSAKAARFGAHQE